MEGAYVVLRVGDQLVLQHGDGHLFTVIALTDAGDEIGEPRSDTGRCHGNCCDPPAAPPIYHEAGPRAHGCRLSWQRLALLRTGTGKYTY